MTKANLVLLASLFPILGLGAAIPSTTKALSSSVQAGDLPTQTIQRHGPIHLMADPCRPREILTRTGPLPSGYLLAEASAGPRMLVVNHRHPPPEVTDHPASVSIISGIPCLDGEIYISSHKAEMDETASLPTRRSPPDDEDESHILAKREPGILRMIFRKFEKQCVRGSGISGICKRAFTHEKVEPADKVDSPEATGSSLALEKRYDGTIEDPETPEDYARKVFRPCYDWSSPSPKDYLGECADFHPDMTDPAHHLPSYMEGDEPGRRYGPGAKYDPNSYTEVDPKYGPKSRYDPNAKKDPSSKAEIRSEHVNGNVDGNGDDVGNDNSNSRVDMVNSRPSEAKLKKDMPIVKRKNIFSLDIPTDEEFKAAPAWYAW